LFPPRSHKWEDAISLIPSDGVLWILHCEHCGLAVYRDSPECTSPCQPLSHDMVPVKIHQYGEAKQCRRCQGVARTPVGERTPCPPNVPLESHSPWSLD
jgi:hypothetical protein